MWTRARFVRAEWVGAECVAGIREGAGTRSTADVAVFASAALTVERVRVVQPAEDLGVAVDIDQRIGANVAEQYVV